MVKSFKIAQNIPFQLLEKKFWGRKSGSFSFWTRIIDSEKEDNYFKDLKFRYFYLLHKYQLEKSCIEPVQFFKHRPIIFQRFDFSVNYIIISRIYSRKSTQIL
jgi:hypothetical protein